MNRHVSIIMYHYVREIERSRYPEIKGLEVYLFREQIEYISKHYNVISAEQLMASIRGEERLPAKALLLTFDDAYIDHFIQVFPILYRFKMPGCFFPPAKCILESQVLDVNKIHFILACVKNKRLLIEYIQQSVDEHRLEFHLETNDIYWERLAKQGQFDTAEVMFVKRMLQSEIDENLRKRITNELFVKYVSSDETSFSRELYMNMDQITCLNENGMYVGSHGYDHYWLNSLTSEKQEYEIDMSLKFLDNVGTDISNWMMCYPHGGYNDSLIKILKKKNCTAGLTINVDIADLSKNHPLVLPRLNTNDLPKDASAPVNEWTLQAIS